jgi:hypothetical protein
MIARSRLGYVQLHLLTDGRGQVTDGWFFYNPQYRGHADDPTVRSFAWQQSPLRTY